MSEPIKKPKHTPESFSPKNKPEILRMAEENAGKSEMKKPTLPPKIYNYNQWYS